jgi:hypothetical protein
MRGIEDRLFGRARLVTADSDMILQLRGRIFCSHMVRVESTFKPGMS